jgi:uncharacterized protein YfaS (alpha-2-macroglobulin family)
MFLFAQGGAEPYSSEWRKADSLIQRGFPESAAKIAQSIYDRASQKGQQVQMMKAQLYLISSEFQRSEEAYQNAIKKAEQFASSAAFPNNAIWQSIAAQLYWTYYQQNRWRLLDRTRTSNNVGIADFEQWDASRFFERASALYQASLSRSAELEKISIEQYDPLLVKGTNTKNLRPTLFDLLAFRALDYFQNDEKDITRPAFSFVMDDAEAFAPANEFVRHNFPSKDTSSLQWQALKLYQRILSLHADDANKDAFIDADLHRLEFAYNKSVREDKKELYKKALERLEQAYSSNPLSALASLRIALVMMGTERTRMDYDQPITPLEKKPTSFPAIKERLENIVAKFPNSEGGTRARALLLEITARDLNIVTEEVVLPGEPSKMLVTYRNVPKASIRVVRVDNSDNKWLGSYNGYSEALIDDLLKMSHLRQWSTPLPSSSDYERHSTEVKIDALPVGTYAVIISADESFRKEDNIVSYTMFQISSLSSVSANNGSGYVLDRKSGAPVANATIDFYQQRYNDNIRGYTLRKTSTAASDKQGLFKYTGERENVAIKIRANKDTVLLVGYFPGTLDRNQQQPQTQTFFFTDRAIYRPGQTIFFKGIMLRKEENGKRNNVVAGEKTTVTLYDVNGQKVSSKELTTNEFGSFTGSFTAPEGLLTGNMRISNSNGTTDFSVEEYKRPKFFVSFDTMRKAYALNETVQVQGKAVAYAGNTVDNATVKYRVVRNTRFPYWWYAWRWGFPQSPEMEIASGTEVTDKDGRFSIDFKAIPDPEVDPASLPVFSYSVTADVTDVNGETRSDNTIVSVGYTALQVSVNVPEQARPEDLDTMDIMTLNLNDQFVATDVQMKIFSLKAPGTVLRKRLWSLPDQFIMDSITFKKHFPNDVYKDEANHLNWDNQATVFERSFRSTPQGMVMVPVTTWKTNGWYVIEVTTMDKTGKPITEKKYVNVWSPENGGKTNEALVVMPQSQSKEPGTEAKVYTLSGYEEMHLMRQVQDMNDETEIKQVVYTGPPVTWTKQITDADRGGIAVTYIGVKENRVYAQQAFINVPWSNKDLSIAWETHRDKIEPGSKETWTMVVKGNKKEKVAAEMVATLYDASLDAFRQHEWNAYGLYPSLSAYVNWNTSMGFGQATGRPLSYIKHRESKYYEKQYDRLRLFFGETAEESMASFQRGGGVKVSRQSVAVADMAAAPPAVEGASVGKLATRNTNMAKEEVVKPEVPNTPPPLRTNMQETAFFFPMLKTDAEGNIRIEFGIPEALTEWKMMAFAHTKDMSYGLLKGSVKTQKDLMVMPNLPRFLRQGDEITISTKISNLSENSLSGTAKLELVNPMTGQSLELPFGVQQKQVSFSVEKGQSTTASWVLRVPESLYEPVSVRVWSTSGSFTDGEENIIPVITNRMLVTETRPLWINGNGSKTFSFDKLKASDTSKTLAQHSLTLEYTGNPAWLAVQSLPYLIEYPYECAEQVFNRYYATALAAHIVAQSPKIKTIFDRWKMESSLSSFMSPLEKNQELKSALLEETPWVLQAKTESEQRKRLGELFDTYKLAQELEANTRKLRDLQLPDGSFPWFKGMRADRFITQYIVTGLGRLQQLGVKDGKGSVNQIITRALPYLDSKIKESYELLIKNKAKMEEQHISYGEVQYLYMRSFFDQAVAPASKVAFNYYKAQAVKHWPSFNPYMKGMIALALHRGNDIKTPATIIQSLKETSIRKEEMGMYWMQRGYSYWWYEAPIEAQALLIECFKEVAKDNASVDAMKIWLLKNKQTQSWETTKATADACYALLVTGTDWLSNEPKVTVSLGDRTFSSGEQKQEAGTGYFKVRLEGKDVQTGMGDVKVSVSDNASSTSWGAVYWQYFENLDKISTAKTPLEITKELFVERASDRGPELHNISNSKGSILNVGDKVVVRIQVIVDRDMEYVHLKDMRASAFEPVNVISSYKWQGGLGYYESTRDVSTNFFFDHLRKGKYVFEYPMFVQQKGDFSNGLATIQCMYAPEFSSHSEGIRVQVK